MRLVRSFKENWKENFSEIFFESSRRQQKRFKFFFRWITYWKIHYANDKQIEIFLKFIILIFIIIFYQKAISVIKILIAGKGENVLCILSSDEQQGIKKRFYYIIRKTNGFYII